MLQLFGLMRAFYIYRGLAIPRKFVLHVAGLLSACIWFHSSPHTWGQWTRQQITLAAGWNPVFLQVDPYPSECDELFEDEDRILSIRKWSPLSPDDVQFDETAGSILPDGGSWLTWFPPDHPNRSIYDLTHLQGSAAYLIEVSDGEPLVAEWTGRPMAISHTWREGIFHFLGLPVEPSASVSFSEFFSPADESIPIFFQQGGAIYRVLSDGSHEQIFQPTLAQIQPGQAYWIKAALPTDYTGPIEVLVEWPGGWMDFGDRLIPQYIEISNKTDAPRTIRMEHDPSEPPPTGTAPVAGKVPLRFAEVNPAEGFFGRTYESLPDTWTKELAAGASVRLAFLPHAAELISGVGSAYQSILTITDAASGPGTVVQQVGVRVDSRSGEATDSAGLWVGEATLTGVQRLEMLGLVGTVSDNPVPVDRSYSFRLLVHVNKRGVARLLQRVLVGTHRDGNNEEVLTQLLSDESLVPAYRSQHPGAKVFRVSAANFPFMDPVELTGGTFGMPLSTLGASVPMSRNDPVNPFLHASAPLHDNKERRADADVPYDRDVEVYTVERHIELFFQKPGADQTDPRWGVSRLGGIYKEKIYGLGGPSTASNRVIKVEGTFRLERALKSSALTLPNL